MSRPYPLKKETPFLVHEIFFSRTDKKGIIESYNNTFVKISQYAGVQLSGAPHNIIRHPDMPRAVFKLLWDTISSDRPIGAYVKNLSRTGSYYWVFALAIPIEGGYLSLRLKPTSAMFQKLPDLMNAMLQVEKIGGMDDSTNLLVTTLKQLGFDSYKEFMTQALTLELQVRDEALAQKRGKDVAKTNHKKENLSAGERMQNSAHNSFVELSAAAHHIVEIRKQARVIISSFTELNLLSINMAVCSEHAGSSGNALAEVTIGFSDIANEIQSQIRNFDIRVSSLIESLADSQFDLGCCRLQTEMITDFMRENSDTDSVIHTRKADLELLLQVTHESTDRALARVNSLMQLFETFLRTLDDLLKTINGLELIRITGKIEVAKLGGDHGHSFETHIAQMAEFLHKISSPMRISNESSTIGVKATERSLNALMILKGNLSEVQISSRIGEMSA